MTDMTLSSSSDTRVDVVERTITLEGLCRIMFDRYAGDNDTKLAWHEKIYLTPGTNRLALPVANIFSFFTAQNTNSAPKVLRDPRKYKKICLAIQSFVKFTSTGDNEDYLEFSRDGEPIEVGTFGDEYEELSGLKLHRSVARLEKGIPNPKERPVLDLPWSLELKMTIYPNSAIKEAEIKNLTHEGGLAVGLGTFRGQFGKFKVTGWS